MILAVLVPLLTLPGVLAAPPEKLGAILPIGSDVRDVVATADGAWVATVDGGAGELWLTSTASFNAQAAAVCSGAAGVATYATTTGSAFWVGCADGTVVQLEVDADGEMWLIGEAIPFGDGAVLALETDGATLWGVIDGTEGLEVTALTTDTGTVASGWPISLTMSGFADTTLLGTVLVVVHGADDVSRVDTSTGAVAIAQENLGGREWVDAWPYGTGSAYLADSSGSVVRFDISNNGYSILLDEIATTVTGVAIDDTDGWMLCGTDLETLVYDFSGAPGSQVSTIDYAAYIREYALTDGYAWGLDQSGNLQILTDRPWVEMTAPSPSSAVLGETFSFSFTADTAGDYTVLLNGSTAGEGTELASGSVDAGVATTVELTVDDAYGEGANTVWVFVQSGSSIGHDADTITVDNPPGAVVLGEANVGFGDELVNVRFDGLDDADIASYTVYLSSVPFTAAEYSSGGPAFVGAGDDDASALAVPRAVSAYAGMTVSEDFYPLTNDVTYYVGVRAKDLNDHEGPMSDILAVTPQATFSASELRGDPGGCGCSSAAGSTAGATLTLLALASLRRRRGSTAARLAAAGVIALSTVSTAHAKDDTPPHFSAQARYGPNTLADSYVQQVFGKNNQMLRGEYGVTSRFVEVAVGAGMYQELGFLLTADGTASVEHDMLTIIPITADATLKLDVLNEQIIVPFGRAGGDYAMWKENWYLPDGSNDESKRTGGKLGWHWAAGGLLRLDPLDRSAAEALEASSGIDNTYLAVEYRQTYMKHDANLLDFSGHEVTIGLKCDF